MKNQRKYRKSTDTVAVAGVPGAASFEVTVLVVLVCTPIAVPVTFTENVHETPGARDAPGGSVTPDTLMLFDPATAVMVPPPQKPVRPFGVDTTRPEGNVSVKATPVKGRTSLGFVIVNRNAVVFGPNNWSSASANDLVSMGGIGVARNGPVTFTISIAI
jgi:hypothetical protein